MFSDMKILHIITSLRTGGAEHLLVDLLPGLKAAGLQVDLLLFDGTRTPFYEQLEEKGITIYSLGKGVFSMYNSLHLFRLKKYMRQYDVVHTHNTPCQLLAAMAGSCTSLLFTTEHNTSNRRRSWKGWQSIDRWMYGKYTHIICVSQATEDNLLEYLNDEEIREKTSIIPNGIDLTIYRQAFPDNELQKRYADKHIVVMVAAFRKQKDQKTLVRAMKQLPDEYVLLLAGEGECRKECEAEVTLLGLRDKVVFLGNCSNVPALLATADVVVLSSHYEGLSLSSIEGMAARKAFVASDVPGLREIVGGAGLLFPHEDPCYLAWQIQRLCEDKVLHLQVSEMCGKRAMQYDISNMIIKYIDIYNK